jgi:RNAse (barnase) inhibitor barstar
MGEIIFNSSNSIKIQNYKNFAKKFQLNKRKVENLNNIYFKIKKNINTGLISISDIEINKLDSLEKNKEKLVNNIKNTQELKTLVKRIIND